MMPQENQNRSARTIAITREVSPLINDCELSFHSRERIDVTRAIAQHREYQNCLAQLGANIVSVPADPYLPDSVFVEDAALVLDELAVIPVMGARSRRAETAELSKTLARYRPVKFLTHPATLDGGDVLRIERSLFVGLSSRTNKEAIKQLEALVRPCGYEVQSMQLNGCLHLKSACTYVGNSTILVNRALINAAQLTAFELLDVPVDEPGAANALLFNNTVLLPASFPKTRRLLDARGFHVRLVDISELQKAEAGVTCCSLLFNDVHAATPG